MPTQAFRRSVARSSPVNFFGWEGRLEGDADDDLCATGRVVTLVLRASWFNLSSRSCTKEIAAIIISSKVYEMELYQILTAIVTTTADVGSAAKGDDAGVDSEINSCGNCYWMMVGQLKAATKVEEQREAKNAASIPNDRTPEDSNTGRLISVGDQPSLEFYRGSSL
ncbi:hypothetical protein B296_00018973 [Ensete ventricosum]|uniref:Uncharacterized protein n=1 Tax=Ensete ventricosum TaxID=4639 RepID=A0A427AKV2_ENSVE|nr:hypothetical protein B296_00018973 [Ensete ventricosum]